ncbi:MAG: hypothetical protein IJW73_01765 [Candidatus Gastranaerophilales bacterium]|nr:hypothetical protein [Candidatus Gastranaerophilales bacterium]
MEEAKITTKNYSEDFNLFYEKKLQNLEDTRVLGFSAFAPRYLKKAMSQQTVDK